MTRHAQVTHESGRAYADGYNADMNGLRRQERRRVPWRLARGTERERLIAGALLLMAVAAAIIWPRFYTILLAVLLALVWAMLVHFFRDPERTPPAQEAAFVSPADGRVVEIRHVVEPSFVQGPTVKVGIFMSLFDVHVNRAPVTGRVALVEHVSGQFRQAFRPEAAEVNEHNLIGLETSHGRILINQIAGILARRIVCWVTPGQELERGQRLGLIKLGSRVEVYLPPDAAVTVAMGDQVYAGTTVLARSTAKQGRDEQFVAQTHS
jgi:phosphatidylserine decarboxylase